MKYPYKQSPISVNINRVQLVVIVLELGVVQSVALGQAQRWLRWAVWAHVSGLLPFDALLRADHTHTLEGYCFFSVGGMLVGKCLSVRRTSSSVTSWAASVAAHAASRSGKTQDAAMLSVKSRNALLYPSFLAMMKALQADICMRWKNIFFVHFKVFLVQEYGSISWSCLSTPPILPLYSTTACGFLIVPFLRQFGTSTSSCPWAVDKMWNIFVNKLCRYDLPISAQSDWSTTRGWV